MSDAYEYYRLEGYDGAQINDVDGMEVYTADVYHYYNDATAPERVYIRLYSATETDFSGNGLAILEPSSCVVTQELNGDYSASLTYPVSEGDTVHSLISAYQILKIPIRYHNEISYQLFRIYNINKTMDSLGLYQLNISAQHVFYDLSRLLCGDGVAYAGFGSQCLQAIFDAADSWRTDTARFECADIGNTFTYSTDIAPPSSGEAGAVVFDEPVSVTAALLDGDTSFVGRLGGYLYRDNFNFTINTEMDNMQSTGVIRYSANMIDIDVNYDYTDVCTDVAFDYAPKSTPSYPTIREVNPLSDDFPHRIYKYVIFDYSVYTICTEEKIDEFFDTDLQNWWKLHQNPSVSITVNFADIERDSKYKDFTELRNYEVGDIVNIYHEGLDIDISERIISKTYDAVTQKATSITIGDFRKSTVREESYNGTVTVY